MNAATHFRIRCAGQSLATWVFCDSPRGGLANHEQVVEAVNAGLVRWSAEEGTVYMTRLERAFTIPRRRFLELAAVRAVAELEPIDRFATP